MAARKGVISCFLILKNIDAAILIFLARTTIRRINEQGYTVDEGGNLARQQLDQLPGNGRRQAETKQGSLASTTILPPINARGSM